MNTNPSSMKKTIFVGNTPYVLSVDEQHVYLAPSRSTANAQELFSDYLYGLSDLLYNDTLYLAYITTAHTLALWRSDSKSFGLFHTITDVPSDHTLSPFLFVYKKRPMLFYPNNNGLMLMQLDDLSCSQIIPNDTALLRAQLESAQKQYKELMQVASDYKADAKKWHDKYVTRS